MTLSDVSRLAEDWERGVAHLREVVDSPAHTEALDRWKRELRAEMRATYEITHPRRAEIMRGLGS